MASSAKNATVHIILKRNDDVLEYDKCYRSDKCSVAYEGDVAKEQNPQCSRCDFVFKEQSKLELRRKKYASEKQSLPLQKISSKACANRVLKTAMHQRTK